MKHVFVLNPAAGSYEYHDLENIIKQSAKNTNIDYEIVYTDYAHHGKVLASLYDKDTTIYAIGGDGSAFDVLNGLKNSSMAIIPCGTGNDFYRMINDQYAICDMIIDTINGKEVTIDYGKCNDHYFLNCTTMGIDANVNDLVCRLLKKTIIPKPFLYAISAVICVLNPKPFEYEITLDDNTFKSKGLLIAIMNGQYYGNGVTPLKNASLNDGYFDVCLIDDLNMFKLLYYLPMYFKGKAYKLKYAHIYKAKDIKIKVNNDIICQSDGETFISNNINITNYHQKLKLRVPIKNKLGENQ